MVGILNTYVISKNTGFNILFNGNNANLQFATNAYYNYTKIFRII